MSALTTFAKSGYASASATIGKELLVIDGSANVYGVMSEDAISADYANTGFMPTSLFSVVVDNSELAAAYPSMAVGKRAVARGKTFRLTEIVKGGTLTTLRLETVTKA
jgi:hypothetical protein